MATFYIASSVDRVDEVTLLNTFLVGKGLTCCYDWVAEPEPDLGTRAIRQLKAAAQCDLFIALAPTNGYPDAVIETGVAMAKHIYTNEFAKPVVMVGFKLNSRLCRAQFNVYYYATLYNYLTNPILP